MLTDGDQAPAFSLPDDTGGTITLEQHRGHPVIVYFYPKDDTPGCTTQAKGFACVADTIKQFGAALIGISPDGVKAHQKFKAKHDLNFPLGSDETKAVSTAYGVWVEKAMYGKTYMGVERSTFLIDKTGTIVRAWHKVKVPGHVDDVLTALKTLK